MIRKLYKYMPLRLEFFDEPMLRATPTHQLNDPFEVDVQHHQMVSILTHKYEEGELASFDYQCDQRDVHYDNRRSLFYNEKNSLAEFELNKITKNVQQLGVVSFTEDYNNLLMWSHYADEHKGMVIEFSKETSWLKYTKSEKPEDYRCFGNRLFDYHRELPERVVYRANRPNFEFPIDVVHDLGESKIFDGYFFCKGDNWIYEKEHRSVLPLEFSDKILTPYTKVVKSCVEAFPILNVSNIKSDDKRGTSCNLTFSDNGLDHVSRTVTTRSIIEDIQNPIFLYAVRERSISGIYLGCRVTDEEVRAVLDAIKANPNFDEDIIVRRAKISTERYSLDFEVISNQM